MNKNALNRRKILRNVVLTTVLALCVLGLGTYQYNSQLDKLKGQDEDIYHLRASLMQNYVRLISSNNVSMKAVFESAYRSSVHGKLSHVELDAFVHYPQYGVSALAPLENPKLAHMNANLTLLDTLDLSDPQLRSEINACLSIDPYVGALKEEVNETIWTYYTSVKGFMYIGPSHAVSDFYFTEDLFEKAFWTEAVPSVNPQAKQIITSLYEDAAGQGMMISISNPVYAEGQFIGVMSYDLGIDLMQRLLAAGPSLGKTILFDEKGLLAAGLDVMHPGDKVTLPEEYIEDTWIQYEGKLIEVSTVVPDQLYCMHQIDQSVLRLAALKSSQLLWMLEGIIAVVIIMLVRNRRLAIERKNLMLIDPMTKLYNRRGLEEIVMKFDALSSRENIPCAVLLVDIDKFKRVNDEYGHTIGDEVIKSVADVLVEYSRSYSTVARWGGEEFLVFIPDVDTSNIFSIAERLRTAVEERVHSARHLSVTISIGVHYEAPITDFEEMVKKADKALYHAKDTGRNQTVIYTKM